VSAPDGRSDSTIWAVIAAGKHLFPFRTEKLSPLAPMVLGAQAPGRVGRRPFSSKGPGRGPSLCLDEPRLVRVARIELPTAAGIRTLVAVTHGLQMGRGVLDGFGAVQLLRFCAAAVHEPRVPYEARSVTR
jgi:hypothetical protein